MISAYSDDFNDVITDLLSSWTLKAKPLHHNSSRNNCPRDQQSADCESGSDREPGPVLLQDLERELYNWSIECESPLSSPFLLSLPRLLFSPYPLSLVLSLFSCCPPVCWDPPALGFSLQTSLLLFSLSGQLRTVLPACCKKEERANGIRLG